MADEKPKALHTLGLQREGSRIKAVHLAYQRNQIVLKELHSIEIPELSHETYSLNSTEEGKRLIYQAKHHLSSSAISSSETLVRPLFVPLKKEKDIAAVVDFQAEPLLPFPLEECLIDWEKIEQIDEGSQLTIFAVKKEHIIRHLEEWSLYGIEPEGISVVPAAIASFATYFLPTEESYYLVHIGYKNTTCALIYNKKLIGAQFIPKGLKDLIEALQQHENLSLEEATTQLKEIKLTDSSMDSHPLLKTTIASFRIEVMKIFFGLAKLLKGEELSKVLITGEGGAFENIQQWLIGELKKEPLQILAREGFDCDEKTLLRYDVPIGLALAGLPKIAFQIDLRKNELAFPNPWKRLIRPLTTYLIACLLFAGATYFSTQTSLGYREDQLKEKFAALLTIMDKSYPGFEMEYEKINEESAPLPLEQLSVVDLFDRVNYLEGEIQKAPQPIALLPNTPRVSDVLAWLANHPNVVLYDEEKKERKPLVEIQQFSYSLIKRPEEKKRSNHYEVKVELEFTSPTPKLAREFHDALIEDSTFVDPKGEVKWSSNRGLYRTSFYLLDKTFYPIISNQS